MNKDRKIQVLIVSSRVNYTWQAFRLVRSQRQGRPGTSVKLEGRNEFSKHDGCSQSFGGRLIVIKRPHVIIKAFLIKLWAEYKLWMYPIFTVGFFRCSFFYFRPALYLRAALLTEKPRVDFKAHESRNFSSLVLYLWLFYINELLLKEAHTVCVLFP